MLNFRLGQWRAIALKQRETSSSGYRGGYLDLPSATPQNRVAVSFAVESPGELSCIENTSQLYCWPS